MSYLHDAKVYFDASHQHPINRVLHHLTNLLAIVAIVSLFYEWRLTLVCLVLTQVLAIGGHALFEKNKPAFFTYPVWITIPTSMMWSFSNWFGLRQVWMYFRR